MEDEVDNIKYSLQDFEVWTKYLWMMMKSRRPHDAAIHKQWMHVMHRSRKQLEADFYAFDIQRNASQFGILSFDQHLKKKAIIDEEERRQAKEEKKKK